MSEQAKPRSKWWPIGVYLVSALLAYGPSLITGNTYCANDLLYFFGPMREFFRQQLASGHFPLWNPYIYCGEPYFADLQTMLFYPVNYLALAFPIGYGFTVFFFIHTFIAACGMHLWLRSLRLSPAGCCMGSLLYSLSGFFWQENIHPPVLAAFAWLPWFFACLENWTQDPKYRNAFFIGLSFAMLFLGGSFQVTLGAVYGSIFYFLSRFRPKSLGAPSWKGLLLSPAYLRKLVLSAVLMAWGAVPLFAQLIPTMEFSKLSVRQGEHQTYDEFNGTFSMQPASLYQFVFPTMGLKPGQSIEEAVQDITQTWDVDLLGDFGYLGVWFPFLVFLAIRRREKGAIIYLAAACGFVLMVALGKYFFLHRLLCAVVPGFGMMRTSFRFIYFYVLCGCALSAWGYLEMEKASAQRRDHPHLLTGALLYGILGLLVACVRFGNNWREALGLALGLAGICLWLKTETWQKLGKLLFQAALFLPLLFYGWASWATSTPRNFDFAQDSEVSQLTFPKPGRALVAPSVPYLLVLGGHPSGAYFPADSAIPLKIRLTAGYNPLHLKKIEQLEKLPLSVLKRLMAIECILSAKDEGSIPGFEEKDLGQYRLYQSNEDSYLSAFSRVMTPSNSEEAVGLLGETGFPLADTALLSEPLSPELSSRLKGQKIGLDYSLLVDEPDHQVFKVRLDNPGLVVFSESNYPGWKAWVDGKPTGILEAEYAFRGLVLDAGSHEVEFKYQPFWWPLIPQGMALWLLSLAPLGWLARGKKAVPSSPPTP